MGPLHCWTCSVAWQSLSLSLGSCFSHYPRQLSQTFATFITPPPRPASPRTDGLAFYLPEKTEAFRLHPRRSEWATTGLLWVCRAPAPQSWEPFLLAVPASSETPTLSPLCHDKDVSLWEHPLFSVPVISTHQSGVKSPNLLQTVQCPRAQPTLLTSCLPEGP